LIRKPSAVGEPIGSFVAMFAEGLFQSVRSFTRWFANLMQTGDLKFKDVNIDG
jgi:hypothetical protein